MTHYTSNRFPPGIGAAAMMLIALQFSATVFAKGPVGKHTAPTTTDKKYAKIDSIVHIYTRLGLFSGVVAVGEKNKITYNKAFGPADRQWNLANDTDTRFEIASVSKQFCAALTLIAAQEGKINLDSPLKKYLPYTANGRSKYGSVSIHDLLAMRSGIPSYDHFENFIYGIARKNWGHREFIETLCDTMNDVPGKRFSYSDANYYILGEVLVQLYGMSYDSILAAKIFTPLQMHKSGLLKNSGYPNGGPLIQHRNSGYEAILADKPDAVTGMPVARGYDNALWTNMSDVAYSSGAIYMTGSDYVRWTLGIENNKLMSKAYRDKMFTEFSDSAVLQGYYPTKPNCPPTGYGYGWVIVHRSPLPGSQVPFTIYTHGGLCPGYSSVGAIALDHSTSMLISSNTKSDAPLFMCWQIMNVLMGVEPNYGGIP